MVLIVPVAGYSDSRLANTVATSAVFGNTDQYTPTIFEMWPTSYACWTDFMVDTNWPTLVVKFQHVPIPCYFTPGNPDGEAILLDHGLSNGRERTYEFWQAYWQNAWHVKWGGADDNANFVATPYGRQWARPDGANYGVQGSGLAFVPGIITVSDLNSGTIAHAVQMIVPTSCTTWVWPATHTDGNASPAGTNDCYQYGTVYKLPQSFTIPTSWPYVDRLIAQAAKNYGLVITDSNHYGVGFRFENYKRPWAWWSPDGSVVDPYSDGTRSNLNFFQCPVPWNWSCYPDQNNLFHPFGQVYSPNTQTFWQALLAINPSSPATTTTFLPTSFWYTPIPTNAPLHQNSNNFVTEFLRQKNTYYGTVSINTTAYTSPVYFPDSSTTAAPVAQWDCQNKGYTDAGLAQQWASVPIPSYAQPADGTDAEMTIYDPPSGRLWEFWQARKVNGLWQACWGGGMSNASSNPGIWPYPYGVAATGLPFIGGQVTAEELQQGVINHVMGISLVDVETWTVYSWPADRSDGWNPSGAPNRIPEGLRFRLDPTVSVDALNMHPIGKIIAKAAQTYGFVVWDKAGAITLRARNSKSYTQLGQPDPYAALFNGTAAYNILQNFPWDRLQFLPQDYGKP
jgi:hypothetical protein